MNYVRALLFALVLGSLSANAQQPTSVQQWRSLMQASQVSFDNIYKTCPHFPVIEKYTDDAAFANAIKAWQKSYKDEEHAFWKIEGIQKANPSAYYLGLSDGSKPEVFASSIWEWVTNSKISEARLNELAAHFPKPVLTGNATEDTKAYDITLDAWIKLYPLEYERLFNASELTALNPYYTGYFKPVQIPAFLSAPLHETKPVRDAYSNTSKGELSYQLSIRAWLFVFEPQTFSALYGNQYSFPEWFSAEKFRADVKQKFEWTKNPPADVVKNYPGK
jgi:hypothetical protein